MAELLKMMPLDFTNLKTKNLLFTVLIVTPIVSCAYSICLYTHRLLYYMNLFLMHFYLVNQLHGSSSTAVAFMHVDMLKMIYIFKLSVRLEKEWDFGHFSDFKCDVHLFVSQQYMAIMSVWTKIFKEFFQHLVKSMTQRIEIFESKMGSNPDTSRVHNNVCNIF